MKKLLFIGLFFFGFVWIVKAGEPTSNTGFYPESNYITTHTGSTTVSSGTVTTIAAKIGYRKVFIQFLPTAAQYGTSVYLKFNGGTSNMTTEGYAIKFTSSTTEVGTKVHNFEWEGNQAITMQRENGVSGTIDTRYTQKEK